MFRLKHFALILFLILGGFVYLSLPSRVEAISLSGFWRTMISPFQAGADTIGANNIILYSQTNYLGASYSLTTDLSNTTTAYFPNTSIKLQNAQSIKINCGSVNLYDAIDYVGGALNVSQSKPDGLFFNYSADYNNKIKSLKVSPYGRTNCTPPPATHFDVSGKINNGVNQGVIYALGDVKVRITGNGIDQFVLSESSEGFFKFFLLANGSYTLTPTKTGYSFNPSTLSVNVNGSNVITNNIFYSVRECPPNTTGAVIIYDHPGCASESPTDQWAFNPPDIINGLTVNSLTDKNNLTDKISSISIPQGKSVKLYPAANLQGTGSACLTGLNKELANSINNQAESIQIFNNSNCTVAVPDPTYGLGGTIKNNQGTGISGATVAVEGRGLSITSNAAGGYSFSGLTNGSYTVIASKTGYTSSSISVAISGATQIGKDIVLDSQAPGENASPLYLNLSVTSLRTGETQPFRLDEDTNLNIRATFNNPRNSPMLNLSLYYLDASGVRRNIGMTKVLDGSERRYEYNWSPPYPNPKCTSIGCLTLGVNRLLGRGSYELWGEITDNRGYMAKSKSRFQVL